MSAAAKADTDLEAFRLEARKWLEENFPPSLKGKGGMMMGEDGPSNAADFAKWKKAMGDKGWGTPTWPKEYGAGGLSQAQARVLQQEMNRIGAFNPIGGMGVMMFGPTLLEYGSPEQKAKHVPGIVKGEVWWCQGYSEPGAGSDLASLRTQCIDKGDHFLVNGSKIWTSGAQFADMCFALVRTDNTKKHEGISFLLIDMKSPGVEVRPIKLISGNSPFCETFFTDVKVPKENLMGPLNGGWTIGKRLLQFERAGLGGGVGGGGLNRGGETRTMDVVAKHYVGANDNGQIADADLRTRITNHLMDQRAFMLTIFRAQAEAKGNASPSATTSIMKNAGSRIGQERAELLVEVMGHQGLGWEGEGFTKDELDTVRGWLGGKATTIYGGSQEIQNNIIAKRILGLLDHQ
ncbi:MAG: acyl-CoA dehydrogenase family protein [Alphaproteobacteria bacterium]|nr:acyl-CoA dehydrogenase family protein [Alphaproteobacteria bacterium]MBV9903726.1 acyl-CoA dehydrogenase family protein [Alphaproteobacteria bacterium]